MTPTLPTISIGSCVLTLAAALTLPAPAVHADPITLMTNLSGLNENPPQRFAGDGRRNDSAGPDSRNTAARGNV